MWTRVFCLFTTFASPGAPPYRMIRRSIACVLWAGFSSTSGALDAYRVLYVIVFGFDDTARRAYGNRGDEPNEGSFHEEATTLEDASLHGVLLPNELVCQQGAVSAYFASRTYYTYTSSSPHFLLHISTYRQYALGTSN